jgi:ubiquinol-cytochrome c reductase cytochrome b subunit
VKLADLLEALDKRIGHRKLLHEALDEPLPGGASWAYVFGSAATILFGVQLVTGLVLATYYSPSATDAWASVAYIESKVTMGSIVRGMHHHAASGMVLVVAAHMFQVVFFGAYKAPREGNWIAGLLLLGLTLAFALTGYLLPWDQTGYWATKVATSIAGTVPLIGGFIQRVIQGGNDYGNLTLTRFYAIHVILLPLSMLILIGVHIALFRKHGVTPSAYKSERVLQSKLDHFWPKQLLYDAIFAFFVIAAVAYYAIVKGAPLEPPAEPASTFIARPEWYFLFLFQLLKYFEGPLQVVGTIIVPGLAATLLLILPFLDRGRSRAVGKRIVFVGGFVGGLVLIGLLSILAKLHDARDPGIALQKERSEREAERARMLAAQGVPPAGAAFMLAHDPLTRGERVFDRECASCHTLEGHGPEKPKGPDLTGYRSRAWIRQVLRDSDSKRLFGITKVHGMKSFAHLPDAELNALVELVYGLRETTNNTKVDARPGGDLLDKHKCTECHELESDDALEGPSLFRYASKEWVRQVVDNAAADHLYGDENSMPIFAKRLSDEDRDAVVTFLLELEHRAPPTAWPFVDDPGPVPTPRAKTSSASGGREG